uniref:Uncharacterized protein n=1 Tax=Anguilla anguilla TaxID=7936 RepID=A0A0E9WP22_ANGAN
MSSFYMPLRRKESVLYTHKKIETKKER